jgi:hypothetical protein
METWHEEYLKGKSLKWRFLIKDIFLSLTNIVIFLNANAGKS